MEAWDGPITVSRSKSHAVGIDQKTAMGLGGALGAPMTAFVYDWNMLPIGQQLWERHLMSYEKFPPLQAPEIYKPHRHPGCNEEGNSSERLADVGA